MFKSVSLVFCHVVPCEQKTTGICLQNMSFVCASDPHRLPLNNFNVVSLDCKKLKQTSGKMPKDFPHSKEILLLRGWSVTKWIATFVFAKNFLASRKHKSLDRESASGKIGGLPERPNSLIASKKQLSTRLTKLTLNLWMLVGWFHFEKQSSPSEEIVQLQKDKEEKCWGCEGCGDGDVWGLSGRL